ncbi:MAG: glycoside hydrolase family 5 protein [Polyangiaceae bacterium]
MRHDARSLAVLAALTLMACLRPAPEAPTTPLPAAAASAQAPLEAAQELDAWTAAVRMAPGINIGNTLENTTQWETGWGNPSITREYVQRLAALGFKSIRLPVAWDTYAVDGVIQPEKLQRVGEVVDWIIEAGLFCVVNIHWDGGWIDSSAKERFAQTHATFSPAAEKKYRAYWTQISAFFANRDHRLLFESLNEETAFDNEGSPAKAFATLTRVNQLFIDTVRATGGNNRTRLLVVAGYHTDITKTCSELYGLPRDTVAHRLFISVHYYTPWPFCGMTEDASWGKMATSWGSPNDVAELERLFDLMAQFCARNDIPAFIGEFGVNEKKESASRVRWMSAVENAALKRKMVPVLWETGHEVSRHAPFAPSPDLTQVLSGLEPR